MDNFITPANAQAQTTSSGSFDFMSLLPLVLIFVVFYFFLIRPQQKKAQQQRELLSNLKRGDRIVTSGGLIGVISKVINNQELQVEIAEGVRVRIARPMVADILSKTESLSDTPEEPHSSKDKKNPGKPSVKNSAARKKKSS